MKLLLMAALLAAQSAPDSDPLCTDVRRLVEAAKDAASFDALMKSGFVPRLPLHCQSNGKGYLCSRNLLPRGLGHHSLGGQVAQCVDPANVTSGDPGWARTTHVRKDGLHVILEESMTEHAHVGRILSVRIERER